jgi:hypothetical protein
MFVSATPSSAANITKTTCNALSFPILKPYDQQHQQVGHLSTEMETIYVTSSNIYCIKYFIIVTVIL